MGFPRGSAKPNNGNKQRHGVKPIMATFSNSGAKKVQWSNMQKRQMARLRVRDNFKKILGLWGTPEGAVQQLRTKLLINNQLRAQLLDLVWKKLLDFTRNKLVDFLWKKLLDFIRNKLLDFHSRYSLTLTTRRNSRRTGTGMLICLHLIQLEEPAQFHQTSDIPQEHNSIRLC